MRRKLRHVVGYIIWGVGDVTGFKTIEDLGLKIVPKPEYGWGERADV